MGFKEYLKQLAELTILNIFWSLHLCLHTMCGAKSARLPSMCGAKSALLPSICGEYFQTFYQISKYFFQNTYNYGVYMTYVTTFENKNILREGTSKPVC